MVVFVARVCLSKMLKPFGTFVDFFLHSAKRQLGASGGSSANETLEQKALSMSISDCVELAVNITWEQTTQSIVRLFPSSIQRATAATDASGLLDQLLSIKEQMSSSSSSSSSSSTSSTSSTSSSSSSSSSTASFSASDVFSSSHVRDVNALCWLSEILCDRQGKRYVKHHNAFMPLPFTDDHFIFLLWMVQTSNINLIKLKIIPKVSCF